MNYASTDTRFESRYEIQMRLDEVNKIYNAFDWFECFDINIQLSCCYRQYVIVVLLFALIDRHESIFY